MIISAHSQTTHLLPKPWLAERDHVTENNDLRRSVDWHGRWSCHVSSVHVLQCNGRISITKRARSFRTKRKQVRMTYNSLEWFSPPGSCCYVKRLSTVMTFYNTALTDKEMSTSATRYDLIIIIKIAIIMSAPPLWFAVAEHQPWVVSKREYFKVVN